MEGFSSGLLTTEPFTVPPGGVLGLDDAYVNAAEIWVQDSESPFQLEPFIANEWMRIDVIKASASLDTLNPSDILATIFDSQSGSPAFTQPWTSATADLSALSGQSVILRVATVNNQECLPVWVDNVHFVVARPTPLTVTAAGQSVNGVFGQRVTAAWGGVAGALSYTCTLMYGFDQPSTFSVTTPSTTCSFGSLSASSAYGIEVVANTGFGSSSPSVGFAAPPLPPASAPPPPPKKHSIVCKKNHGTAIRSVTAVHSRCPSGWHRIA